MRIGGRFNGTAADLYICIGFVPDFCKVWNQGTNTPCYIEWNKHLRDVLANEGLFRPVAGGAYEDMAIGAGIQPYYGGETLVTGTGTLGVGTTTYGSTSSVYLHPDNGDTDYSRVNSAGLGIVGDALVSDINTWTLGNSTNYTGNFNADVTGTYIGMGSRVQIDGKDYYITALTATEGSGANEVTLNLPAPTGEITYIGGKYNMISYNAGELSAAGFMIGNATVNESAIFCSFDAGMYDN